MRAPEIGTKVTIVRPDNVSIEEGIATGDVAKIVGFDTSLKSNDLLIFLHNPKWEKMRSDILDCGQPCLVVYLSECDVYEEYL